MCVNEHCMVKQGAGGGPERMRDARSTGKMVVT